MFAIGRIIERLRTNRQFNAMDRQAVDFYYSTNYQAAVRGARQFSKIFTLQPDIPFYIAFVPGADLTMTFSTQEIFLTQGRYVFREYTGDVDLTGSAPAVEGPVNDNRDVEMISGVFFGTAAPSNETLTREIEVDVGSSSSGTAVRAPGATMTGGVKRSINKTHILEITRSNGAASVEVSAAYVAWENENEVVSP